MAVRPCACSGERYCGVPITSPVWVSPMPSAARAMPKSVTFTRRSGRDEQVGGLDVAVHDAGGVRGPEAVGGLGQQLAHGCRIHRRPGPDQRRERLPVDELHDEVGPARTGPVGGRGLPEVVDGRDVGVVQRRGVLGLDLEAGAERRVSAYSFLRTFTATWRSRTVSVARQTSPMPPVAIRASSR